MSRTYRYQSATYRAPKNQAQRRADEAFISELPDIDYKVSKINRIKSRSLKSVYDDVVCSAWYEQDYK